MEFTTHLELQSQTTRLVESRSYTQLWKAWTGLSPSKAVRSRTLCPSHRVDLTSPDYNSEDFQSELFPLHSPLLRESWLVSFPPPSYMLKFSGYSCLIGGPKMDTPQKDLIDMGFWSHVLLKWTLKFTRGGREFSFRTTSRLSCDKPLVKGASSDK